MIALMDLDEDDPTPCRDRSVRFSGREVGETATAVFEVSPQLLALAANDEETMDGKRPRIAPPTSAVLARTLQSPAYSVGSSALPSLASDDDEQSKALARESTVVMSDTVARRTVELVRIALAKTEISVLPPSEPRPHLLQLVPHVQVPRLAPLSDVRAAAPSSWRTMISAIALGLFLAAAIGTVACFAMLSYGYITL